jgi:hypothetical protein
MRDDAAYGIADSTNPRMILLAWGRVALAMLTLFGVWPLGGGDPVMHQVVGR